jgi:isopentenyl-diphosphate delta-isomerase
MEDELLDLVNEKDEIIGTVWKSQAHKDPKLIHREVGIAIFNTDGYVLLQQRSINKAKNPGMWTVSATGHINMGEDPAQAVIRETREELGLEVEPVYFKKKFNIASDKKEARFMWGYYAIVKGQPTITPDPSEVMDYTWVKVEDLEDFSKTHDYDLTKYSHTGIMEVAQYLNQQGIL